MATTPNLGLTIWTSPSDTFNSTQLAANFSAIDADYTRTRPTDRAEVRTTVPSSSNFEGRLVYLSAADGGFAAGTLIRYTGAAFRAVAGLELLAAVPTLGNFAGRVVLLSSASGSFAQWTLIRYDGSAWAPANYTYELLASVPVTGNFAGRLVMLTAANGGFNAYDLIRYNGSTFAKIGPQPVPPSTELAYFAQATDLALTNAATPGDTITTFSAATFENVKHYFEISIPRLTVSVNMNVAWLLRESGSTVGTINLVAANSTVERGVNIRMPFTPSAALHTYGVTWYISTAGTATMLATGFTPPTFRIIKA